MSANFPPLFEDLPPDRTWVLEARTTTFVGGVIEKLLDLPEPGVYVYRSDAEYHAATGQTEFPASWHRAVIARTALEVPGLAIAYAPTTTPST